MKRILFGLIFILSVNLVGCSYSMKDKEAFQAGEKYYGELKKDDGEKSLMIQERLSHTISILDGSSKDTKYKDVSNERKYSDYKYGILSSAIEDLNESKEKGIESIFVSPDSWGKETKHSYVDLNMELDELQSKQIDLYDDDFKKIVEDYITLFDEIDKEYKGEQIDKKYQTRLNEIEDRFMTLSSKVNEQYLDVMTKKLYGVGLDSILND